MTEPVKRYYIMESAVVPMLDKQMTYTPLVNYKTDVHVIPLVMDADYARLEQECGRLSNELNNMRISWGLMQSERDAALRQVDRLRAHLKLLLNGESGRWLLAKLDDGQGTELEDGKAWLAAREAISGD